ncbi:tyrosine-type recombinase/integrase [Streptomyces geranii]|uniref:tyrosine-type recombinase/integrase n=1 Tax=Streptomyces geranii TaxID=2058923 RepID=UPI000D03B427
MPRRSTNGEGTVYRRKSGRYVGSAWVLTTSGERKRRYVYGATRAEARANLNELLANHNQGIPSPDAAWRLEDYLDAWLESVVKPTMRPKTYEQYELIVRLHLKPGLGQNYLKNLGVMTVQTFLNQQHENGASVRRVQMIRTVLSSALTRAMREELITRNVARLVVLPKWRRRKVDPWTVEEATRFLAVARGHRLYAAFVLALYYGMRRGEILGLRWQDIDFQRGTFNVEQQLQRVGTELLIGPVKTDTSRRGLPLVEELVQALRGIERKPSDHDLVFTSTVGTPLEPRNFVRLFWRLREQAGLREIVFHYLRHTQATMLEHFGVPVRTAQIILGHSSPSVTQQVYQHGNMELKQKAIESLQDALRPSTTAPTEESEPSKDGADSSRSCQNSCQSLFARIFSMKKHRQVAIYRCFFMEGQLGLEPRTPCLKAQSAISLKDQITEARVFADRRTRSWMVGIVAVNLAVKC